MMAPNSSTTDRGEHPMKPDLRAVSSKVNADSELLLYWMQRCQAIKALWQGRIQDLKASDIDTVYSEVTQKIALAVQFPRFVPRSGLSSFETGLDLLVATLRNDYTAINVLVCQQDLENGVSVLVHVALFVAVEKGLTDVVTSVLLGDFDVDTRTLEGLTCLHVAAERNNPKMVQLLLSKGANVNSKRDDGHTPFSQICGSKDHEAVAGILIACGAEKNVSFAGGASALYGSAANGETEKVRTMLYHGLDPSFETVCHWTPLHWAANNGHLDIVELLVKAGADVDCISDTFKTPLDLVNSKGDSEVMDRIRTYIISHGATTTQQIQNIQEPSVADTPSLATRSCSIPFRGNATKLSMPLYQPLNENERDIRLLVIEEPGASPDVPTCLLQTFPIDAAPPYYALSYTWGDPDSTGPLFINNHKVEHTANAIAAITTLRDMLPLGTVPVARHVWVDAICIDQNNIAEKNYQIPLMGDIYSHAKRVLVWLGEESDNSSAGMELLVQLGYMRKLQSLCVNSLTTVSDGGQSFDTIREDGLVLKFGIGQDHEAGFVGVELSFNIRPGNEIGLAFTNQLGGKEFTSPSDVLKNSWFHEAVKPRWDAMSHLFHRPYWSRAWILQEIGLACSDPSPLLICGQRILTWNTLRNALEQLLQLMSEWDLNTEQNREVSHGNLGSWIRGQVLEPLEPIRWILDRPETRSDYDMIDLVCFTSQSLATNPRDKIYALLGLVSPGKRSSIVPDYELPVKQVYTDFVLAEIQRTSKLDVLCLEHQLADDKEVAHLPSWVLDLTSQTRQGFPPTLMRSSPHAKERSRASGGELHAWCVPGNAEELVVRGIHCCTVQSTTPPRGFVGPGGHDIMSAWLEFAQENLPEELPGGLPLSQVFFRTLIRDMSGAGPPGHETIPEESGRLRRLAYTWIISHMMHQVQPDKYTHQRLSDEFHHITRHQHGHTLAYDDCRDECFGFDEGKLDQQLPGEVLILINIVFPVQYRFAFFTTAKGYLGLGPRYMREGDILVVLAGMGVPAILRPMHDHYIFLGDCYVYDLMQGQAVRSAREEGRGFDEFILR